MNTVTKVKPLENYILELEFNNSEIRFFDVSSYLNHGKFSELQDIEMFNSVKVFYDTVNWENGVDLCPETLYDESFSN